MSIHLSPGSVAAGVRHFYSSPRSVTGGVRPWALAMWRFYSFVSQVCHWRCPPFSVGHAAPPFFCLPGLSLLVSALFRWRCNISIRLSPGSVHLSPRSVTAGVRPFPLPMQHFCSFVPQACHWWCPPFSAVSIHLSPRSVTCVSQACHW